VSSGITFHAPESAKECEGMKPHTPQMNSHFGSYSPNGLSNFQRAITGVKTHWIEMFFTSLERSWNVDVSNELA